MGINKDLNIDPYYENFYDPENPQYKQYNRVLFRPARAVQARELTQLQTILQEQIGRFGSNVYQEGTIIRGINPTQRTDLFYIKLKDTTGLPDPTIYEPSTAYDATIQDEVTTEYTLRGQTTQLNAKILKASNGFQTRDPDLKTFYVNYLNTNQNDQDEDIKEFNAGEVLDILDGDGTKVAEAVVAEVNNHAGRAFGASVDEGIIYQKGAFIFAEEQLIIIEKYSNTPRDVALGFNIKETIVTSNEDSTLLDNAQGYNNDNAPGADRLKLEPVLEVYEAGDEPDDFFSLIRFERGEPIQIRDVTAFNSIAKELARRTHEESGDYVVRGFDLSLDQDADGTYVVVNPGKAYVKGFGVELTGKKYLPIISNASTEYVTRNEQATGAEYGQFFEFNWEAPTGGPTPTSTVLNQFQMDGTRYNMYDLGNNNIGSCSIRAVTSGPSVNGTTEGRLYVYGITKLSGYESTDVHKIGDTIITSQLREVNKSRLVFPTGGLNMKSVRNLRFVERRREAITAPTGQFVLEAGSGTQPLTTNIVVVNSVNELLLPTSVTTSTGTFGTDVSVTLGELGQGTPAYAYYDQIVQEVDADTLEEVDVYVISTANNGRANLGIPNGVKLLEVVDDGGNGEDITSRFKLVNNQKDQYYDLSYIQLRRGQSLRSASGASNLRIKFTALRRTSTVGNGYLTVDSYASIDKKLLKKFQGRDGSAINLLNSIDFRPYHAPEVEYATGIGAAQSVSSSIAISFEATDKVVSPRSLIMATHDVYMPRIDLVAVDSRGEFTLVKGSPSEKPSIPNINSLFQLGEVFVPGGQLDLSGANGLAVTKKTVKNYTMKDIRKFDTQISRLTNQVALNALEKSASEMMIPDANGDNRFKNGFIVDTFESLATSDVTDPDFKMSIDASKKIGQPTLKTFEIDLKRRASTSSNDQPFSKITTLGLGSTAPVIIDQPYATNSRLLVSNYYDYKGSVVITPDFVSDYDTVRDPDVEINIDIATPMIDLLENIQEFYPMTRTDPVGEAYLVDTSGEFFSGRDGRWNVFGVNETWRQDYETLTIGYDTTNSTQEAVGDFVTDVSFKPYVKGRDIKILATGLRPNTRHYFFFADGTDINSHVLPGQLITRTDTNGSLSIDPNDIVVRQGINGATTAAGQAIRTDSQGRLAAIFRLPEGEFFVGENNLEITDVSNYGDIESGGTSYGKATYRAYRMGINRAALDVTTRSPDFKIDITEADSQDNVLFRETRRERRPDPLAQTFFIKEGMAEGTKAIYMKEIDLYFKRKDATAGVTVEIREVQNGYPSAKILPFGKKYLTSDQVNVSTDGTVATTVTFDNPIKLDIEREYAFVCIPDANSPEYLIWTSKVGETDLSSDAGVPVTQDWGDGMLFTSTNNRAWKSYQDEDVKFKVRKYTFSTDTGYTELVPNDYEFLTVSGTVHGFQQGEFAYVKKSSAGQYTVASTVPGSAGRQITINSSTAFDEGDYVVLEKGTDVKVSRIEEKTEASGVTTLTLFDPVPFDPATTGNINITFAIAGRVSYFNGNDATKLHIKESSAKNLYRIIGDGSEVVRGEASGASATIQSVDDIPLSYFQPLIHKYNTTNTNTTFQLMDGSNVDKPFSSNDNVYMTGNARVVPSKSNIVDTGQTVSEDFAIRVTLSNNGLNTTSPTLDDDLSILNGVQYTVTDTETTTSAYVSKIATLSDRMYAEGLKVFVGAYRPAGIMVDTYARFITPTDSENFTDWFQLDQVNTNTFSATHNIRDYRELEYNLDESVTPAQQVLPGTPATCPGEYSAYQIKIVMRHMTTAELEANDMDAIDPEINLFAHLADMRAIAVT